MQDAIAAAARMQSFWPVLLRVAVRSGPEAVLTVCLCWAVANQRTLQYRRGSERELPLTSQWDSSFPFCQQSRTQALASFPGASRTAPPPRQLSCSRGSRELTEQQVLEHEAQEDCLIWQTSAKVTDVSPRSIFLSLCSLQRRARCES